MDDDGYPDCKALEHLSNNLDDKHSCISSVVLNENSESKFVFPFQKYTKSIYQSSLGFLENITQ